MKIKLTEAQMPEFGRLLGRACEQGSVIYLQGDLGMGKTTLSRCIIQGLGWQGRVKSPTYNLVEEYALAQVKALHFDLYRLSDPEELEFIGIRDYDDERCLWLIEWPEKGAGVLPNADIELILSDADEARWVEFIGKSDQGRAQIAHLKDQLESF